MSNIDRYSVESSENWRGKIDKIPFIPFPRGWRVSVIPPFGGAIARFLVKLPKSKVTKSVYLDWNNTLGYYGNPPIPYWEVHPYRGDVGRCDMGDIPKLLRMIADRKEKP